MMHKATLMMRGQSLVAARAHRCWVALSSLAVARSLATGVAVAEGSSTLRVAI